MIRTIMLIAMCLVFAGCELVADFDRGKIPQPHRDAGVHDAGHASDAATSDAAPSSDAATISDAAPGDDGGADDASR